MKLVDLKRKKEPQGKKQTAEIHGPQEDYPYGTRVSLEHEELKKLGHPKMKVGDVMHLHGHAHVVGVHQDERDGEKPRHRVELHIKKMSLAPHKAEAGQVRGKDTEMAAGAKGAMDAALADQPGDDSE